MSGQIAGLRSGFYVPVADDIAGTTGNHEMLPNGEVQAVLSEEQFKIDSQDIKAVISKKVEAGFSISDVASKVSIEVGTANTASSIGTSDGGAYVLFPNAYNGQSDLLVRGDTTGLEEYVVFKTALEDPHSLQMSLKLVSQNAHVRL